MTKPATPKNIVLYADDDADDLELVQDAFARYSKNVDVVTVSDGSQAIQYLTRLRDVDPRPCLVILDINMPILNGKEVLIRLRQLDQFESTPVVLFTTSSLPQDQSFAKKYNAGFVTKPLDVSQMKVITELFIDHCADDIKKKIRRHLL
ncbi:MAG TPA: response regulator [Flavisolibacter sp.]|nr:response regulator [Flavisolibacter sp.]